MNYNQCNSRYFPCYRYVVVKLILFEFVNTFLSLFYIAFYMQDVQMLKSQVQTMLIVLQIVNQLQETILPIVLRRPSTKKLFNKIFLYMYRILIRVSEGALLCELELVGLVLEVLVDF